MKKLVMDRAAIKRTFQKYVEEHPEQADIWSRYQEIPDSEFSKVENDRIRDA